MNAPVNPQKPMVPIATDTNKRMGFNNFVKDIQGVMPIQPMMAPQMPPSMPQQAMVPQIPAMPASSQSIRGGIGMPMAPVQGFQDGGAAGLTNVEKILIRDHGFSLNPQGQVVSPAGQIRTVVDGKTTFSSPVSAPAAPVMPSEPTVPQMQTMNVAPATFSTGTPLPPVNPNAGVATPVTSPEEEPVSTLTPIQQAAQALQQKIEDVGFDTYKKRDDEYNVRFADGTSKFDQDILDQFGVSKSDFLDALRDYGNYVGSVGTRQSAGAGFEQGLENILNPEEAQERYDARLAARKADERRDARTAAQIQRAQEASKLKTGQGFLADLQAAYQDPLGGLDDIGRAILDGSLFTPKPGQLFYQGGDDTPSAPTDTYTDMGTIPDELQFPAMDSALSSITQSDLPPAGVPYDAGEFVNANVSDISGIPIDPSSGVLPSSDLGRLLSGDPQIVDDVIKLLAIDPEKTKRDLLSTATTTLGPDRLKEADTAPTITADTAPTITSDLISLGDSGVGGGLPNISGIGDAPVLPTEDSMKPEYYTQPSSSADNFKIYLPYIDPSYPFDLSGLPRTPPSFYPSNRLITLAGQEGPIRNEQELQELYDYFEDLAKYQSLGPEDFAPYPEQSDSLIQQFRDAQPEGALKGGAFDFVPDAEQLGNFMRGIISPAGAAEAPVDRADLQRQLDALKENQVYDAALADIPINPLVDSPIGSLPAAPRTGVGTISGEGVTGTARSTDDLLDDIKTGAVTTTYYKQPTTGFVFPSNVEFTLTPKVSFTQSPSGLGGRQPDPYTLIDGSLTNQVRGANFTITNPDGSKTYISSIDNPEEYKEFVKGLDQIDIEANMRLVDDPMTDTMYNLGQDDLQTGIKELVEPPLGRPIEISMITEDALQKQSDAQLPALREEAGGGGSQGSGLLGDLTGFEQRFQSDAPTEIAELNNQSQLTDLTNLLNESGKTISDADADAIEGLNILSSEFSDSDQDASSGDVLANILNTGDDATGDAIGGGASGGQGLSDADINVINDAIANMTGDDDTGDATGEGTGDGIGTGDGDGTGSGTGSGTGTGTGDGDGDGDDTGTGGGGEDVINIPPSGGDSGGGKQERRDYSRIREILEQRPRRIGGTAPGLGYKPVEGISNTLNKAADNFLDALRFG